MKLSKAQERCLQKLQSSGRWMTAYDLQERMVTLDKLAFNNLVMKRGSSKLGAMFCPQTTIEFKVTTNAGG